MKWKQITVRARLVTTFGLLASLVLVVSALSINAMNEANDRFDYYVNSSNARAQLVQEVRIAVDRRAMAVRNLVLVATRADVDAERAAAMHAHQDVVTNLDKLNNAVGSDPTISEKARALVTEINRVEDLYGPVALAIVDAALHNQHDRAIAMIDDQCRPLLAQLIQATEAYANYARARALERMQVSAVMNSRQRSLQIGISVIAVAAAVISAILIIRMLMRELGAEPTDLSSVTRRIASGDLTNVPGASRAPKDSVLASMGQMQIGLVQLISEVSAAAGSIAIGSSEIASGNQDLSSRTEEQASSLQETATSMEELALTVRQNAENAQQASALASDASEIAQKCGKVVGQVVENMSDVSKRSSKIAEITSVIEGIAFKTNILALNAAVEAARAGAHGRGFAVVANEVRNLAQSSSNAAKEIKELLAESVEKIRVVSRFVDDAGVTMVEVTRAVGRVRDIMGEIAAAAVEQSNGVDQVNRAVSQMDEVTQQNAALVEEAAAASNSLNEQGQRLTAAVSFFRIGVGQQRHLAALLPPPANLPFGKE